ncbi:MAG: hypothetical protein ABII64_02470 [Elusimicrobiota bacterium]
MKRNSMEIVEMDRLLRTLVDLTGSFTLKNLITKIALDNSPSLSQFGREIQRNETFIKKQVADMIRCGLIKAKGSILEYFIWFVYSMRLGRLDEYRNQFAAIILEPIFPIDRMMYGRLIAEYGITAGRGTKYVDDMMKAVYWMEEYNKAYCKKNKIERTALSNGVCSLYLEQNISSIFSKLCLACCTYFNSTFIDTIAAELIQLENKRNKSAEGKRVVDITDVFKQRIDPILQGDGELNNPIGIVRKIIHVVRNAGETYDVISKEFIKKEIREYCVKQGYKPDTIAQEMGWVDDCFHATERHKTIWINEKPETSKIRHLVIERAVNDIADDDVTEGQKAFFKAVFCEDYDFENIFEGIPDGIPIEQFKEKYLGKVIKEKYNLHHVTGALLMVVYCWENRRVMMPDKICLFLDFVLEKAEYDPCYMLIFRIFIESFLVGTSYKNIILGRIDTGNMPGMPAGIYFSADELAGNVEIDKEQIRLKCKAIIEEFREKYVTRKFGSSDIVYTARTWATDKTKYMTIVEQSLICGNVVPGTRADLYYVMPLQLIESFERSSNSLLDRLIKYVEFYQKSCDAANMNRQKALMSHLLTAKDELRQNMDKRREMWDNGKPHITFTDTENMNSIMTKIFAETENIAEFSKERYIQIEMTVIALLILILAMREREVRQIRMRDITLSLNSLVVIGKPNRVHFESRILILCNLAHRLLDSFLRLSKRVSRLLPEAVIRTPKSDELFIYPKDAAKALNRLIQTAMNNSNANADNIRKYSVSSMHNNLVKTEKSSYEDFQAIIGHVFGPGHEKLGPFNYTGFSRYESIMSEHAKPWEKEINTFIERMDNLWK